MLSLQGSDYTAVRDIFDNPQVETDFEEIDSKDYMPELQTSNDVQVPPVRCPLTNHELNTMKEAIDPLASCSNFGISIYINAKTFLYNILSR